ncbi:HAD family hydrolase [Rhizosphaericola mali]|uniref:HAD family phosphatase n=1 Tax=Rhizosphaericola mali TaxID=2545455 RepID=A0A5P2G817_9BACT|nr:HAD family phosphatase [Rhizosphaericola mali]QES90062.1 HAD family phosphatase [Rhizosphaericola mali]
MTEAFLFDMNGTMIDDMEFHRKAWYRVFVDDLGATLTEEEAKKEMYGKNEEVLDRIFGPGKFTPEQIDEIVEKKEQAYQDAFRPHLKLIDGLQAFLDKAKEHNIKLAIGTAAPKTNVDFAVDALGLRKQFPVIVGAEDVATSKPDPEVFLKCAEALGANPHNSIVFEDSPKGVEAAKRGGMKAVVLLTFHEPEDFKDLDNILFSVKDYTDPRLEELFK